MIKYQHPRFLFRRYEIMRHVKPGRNFLEVGPGNLGLAQDLLSKFSMGTLLDFNTTEVQPIYDGLRPDQKQRLQLIIADFSEYNGLDRGFDCVVACEVLEHIEKDRAFLQKAYELLADRGQLVLSVPARQKFWDKDDQIAGHFRRYEKQGLTDLLQQVGFSQIKIVSYGFPFQNVIRLARIAIAKRVYAERAQWDKKKQSQESAFLIKRTPRLDWLALLVNKYTLYPFSVIASLFNGQDWAEGYVAMAVKSTGRS